MTRTLLSFQTTMLLAATLLVGGCMAAYSPAPLPTNHPANPAAPETSPPSLSHAFNHENSFSTPTEEASVHNPHAGHDMRHGGHQ